MSALKIQLADANHRIQSLSAASQPPPQPPSSTQPLPPIPPPQATVQRGPRVASSSKSKLALADKPAAARGNTVVAPAASPAVPRAADVSVASSAIAVTPDTTAVVEAATNPPQTTQPATEASPHQPIAPVVVDSLDGRSGDSSAGPSSVVVETDPADAPSDAPNGGGPSYSKSSDGDAVGVSAAFSFEPAVQPSGGACSSSRDALQLRSPSSSKPKSQTETTAAATARPAGSGASNTSCMLCHQMLFGVYVECGTCGGAFHAQCVQRSSQDVHKSYTCEKCALKTGPKRGVGATSQTTGTSKRSKAARSRQLVQHQDILSLV